MPPKLHEIELTEWAQAYSGPRFHGVLSDPPYALISIAKRFSKAGSAPAQEGSDGRYSRLSGGFMGQGWDSFETLDQYQDWIADWSELLISNVLYPGAACLFFGGTRTFHHLGVGLERGGFEIVDCLMWLHGQGFPKSHDISKGVDKAAGAEREIIGVRDAPGYANANVKHGEQGRTKYEFPKYSDEAATKGANEWRGYGTAIKPAWEPIFLCRAPRDKKTFAQLATEFGSGALNIDGTRVGARWPANLILDDEAGKLLDAQVEEVSPSRFFYTAKASRGEKDKGLENFYWERVDAGFERVDKATYETLDESARAKGCIHPTVKPLKLTTYLAKLILPATEGRLLVPFSGSGSEILGGMKAGWNQIHGIELDKNYNSIAQARIDDEQ